ncbi:hypothetical protein [uncultured Aurantimicrobium sp.]|uniref:hypothetical protein n=1 Tax=uncultured Aurantimicrobium sp. TaxID=1705357 RepID=UPI002612E649|nr:hypothetical protein [uncultured Aurantimicrobium sp.]
MLFPRTSKLFGVTAILTAVTLGLSGCSSTSTRKADEGGASSANMIPIYLCVSNSQGREIHYNFAKTLNPTSAYSPATSGTLPRGKKVCQLSNTRNVRAGLEASVVVTVNDLSTDAQFVFWDQRDLVTRIYLKVDGNSTYKEIWRDQTKYMTLAEVRSDVEVGVPNNANELSIQALPVNITIY